MDLHKKEQYRITVKSTSVPAWFMPNWDWEVEKLGEKEWVFDDGWSRIGSGDAYTEANAQRRAEQFIAQYAKKVRVIEA